MRKLYHIIIILTLIGCSSSKSDKLKSDLTAINVFEDSEIRDLSIILKFFNEQICTTQQIDIGQTNDCYKSFFERMEKAGETGNIEIKIPFSEQQKMYESISDSTFNQIWSFGKSWNRDSPDTLKYLGLRYDGKYAEFLKTLGKENKVIEVYYEAFEASGAISPSMVAGLLMNYEVYDIHDIRIKLIVAIHYLTMNDQYERKEKY
jgi:hypothetical protein